MRFQSWIVMSGDLVKRWMHSLTKSRSLKQKSKLMMCHRNVFQVQ